jgi:hypothetical protein
MLHSLKPSIYNPKTLQEAREYIQMQLRMAYPTYEQNDIRTAELSAQ